MSSVSSVSSVPTAPATTWTGATTVIVSESSHTFGDNSRVVLGGDNKNFGYNYHVAPEPPAAEPQTFGAGRSGTAEQASGQVPADYGRSRSVFVVHGRDEEVRQAMFGLLRRLDLRPLEWEELVQAPAGPRPSSVKWS